MMALQQTLRRVCASRLSGAPLAFSGLDSFTTQLPQQPCCSSTSSVAVRQRMSQAPQGEMGWVEPLEYQDIFGPSCSSNAAALWPSPWWSVVGRQTRVGSRRRITHCVGVVSVTLGLSCYGRPASTAEPGCGKHQLDNNIDGRVHAEAQKVVRDHPRGCRRLVCSCAALSFASAIR
jgi:hypothetical protein